jgi:hypothetical protein
LAIYHDLGMVIAPAAAAGAPASPATQMTRICDSPNPFPLEKARVCFFTLECAEL